MTYDAADLVKALRITADFVEQMLESGELDYYYWGYNDTAFELRRYADIIERE